MLPIGDDNGEVDWRRREREGKKEGIFCEILNKAIGEEQEREDVGSITN